MGAISNPSPGSKQVVAKSEVYNAGAPVADTDLDLSATVGSRVVEVKLSIFWNDVGEEWACRTNGDTDDYLGIVTMSRGIQSVGSLNASQAVVKVWTDGNGVIEHIASAASAIIIDVLGWTIV